jgi:hypothetical protein
MRSRDDRLSRERVLRRLGIPLDGSIILDFFILGPIVLLWGVACFAVLYYRVAVIIAGAIIKKLDAREASNATSPGNAPDERTAAGPEDRRGLGGRKDGEQIEPWD